MPARLFKKWASVSITQSDTTPFIHLSAKNGSIKTLIDFAIAVALVKCINYLHPWLASQSIYDSDIQIVECVSLLVTGDLAKIMSLFLASLGG